MHLLHQISFTDIQLILKEEMQDEQLYITPKAVQYWDVDTLGFFLGLFPGINIKFY